MPGIWNNGTYFWCPTNHFTCLKDAKKGKRVRNYFSLLIYCQTNKENIDFNKSIFVSEYKGIIYILPLEKNILE